MRSSLKSTSSSPPEPGPEVFAEDESTGSRSVRRALDIFELMLQRAEPITVAQIVAELSIPKSTAYELVRTLSEGDYLAPSGRGSVASSFRLSSEEFMVALERQSAGGEGYDRSRRCHVEKGIATQET